MKLKEHITINPISDYPECLKCPAFKTLKCPALYRKTENCPYYENIIKSRGQE